MYYIDKQNTEQQKQAQFKLYFNDCCDVLCVYHDRKQMSVLPNTDFYILSCVMASNPLLNQVSSLQLSLTAPIPKRPKPAVVVNIIENKIQ